MEMRTVTSIASSCTATARTIPIHRPQERPQRRRRRCNSTAQRYTWIILSSSYCCSSSAASEAYQQYTHHRQLHATSQCALPVQQMDRCDEYQPLCYSRLYNTRGGSSSSGEEQLEDKELDAYIESLIATADDTTSEAEDLLLEMETELKDTVDKSMQFFSVPQSNDASPDESSMLVDDDDSNEQEATETLQTTVNNIPIESNNPVIDEEEEEEEESVEDDEEDIPIESNNPVIEEEDEEEESVEDDEEDIPIGSNNSVVEEEEEEEEEEESVEKEEDKEDIPINSNNRVVEEEDENDDEEEEDEEEEDVSETPTAVEGKEQDGEDADDESDNEVEEEDDVSEAPTAENDVIERNQVIEEKQEDNSEKPAGMEEDAVVTNANDPALAHTSSENDMQRDSSRETMARPRPQPPNPVYLFLLRRGTVGHVLAMGLVLVVELIQTYLPTLARFLAWLWFRLAPARLQKGAALPRRRRRPNPPALATVRNPRTAQSGKLRKKLTQQADQQALAQLKRAGSVGDARYRYVSTNFLQRHGLGPFADATSSSASSSTTTTDDSPLKAGSSKTQQDAEEDDDVDWVVQALTKDKKDHQSKKSSWQPTVSVGMGPGGPSLSVGVEFGASKESKDRRSSIIKSAATSTVVRKKRKVTRASDRDGGSGVVGRIRAVTGANSRVSRSLFGAYPGDAVSLEEAASTKGVVELARKYGYGDWSDDDDDRDDEGEVGVKHRRVKSRRRHSRSNLKGDDSRHSSSNTISAEWKSSSSSGTKSKRKHTRRSGSFSKTEDLDLSGRNVAMASHRSSRSSARRVRPNHPLASSSVLGKKPGSYRAADLAKATTIRPAMERVRHVRRNATSKRSKEDD
jgi:hypothetical protein